MQMYFIYVYVLFCFIQSACETPEFCATFQFNFNNPNDKSTVSIDFSFINLRCGTLRDLFISISSFHEKTKTYNVRCRVEVSGGECKSNAALCGCSDKEGHYWFRTKLKQSDPTKWKWSTSGQEAEFKVLNFDTSYPPTISNLTVNGQDGPVYVVHGNKSVQVKCSWIKGYSASNVRLVDSMDTVLARSESESNELTHEINLFQCQNDKAVRCEAEMSDQSLSTTIVVTCPPLLQSAFRNIVSTSISETARVIIPLRLGIFNISECHVTKYLEVFNKFASPSVGSIHYCTVETITSHNSANTTMSSENNLHTLLTKRKEKCACFVHGSKPNLTLTLHIFHVEMYDDGRWVLTVSNMEGNSSTDFQLRVLNPSPRIIGLTLNGQGSQNAFSVPINQSVQVECTWDNSFPPTTARLIDAHGNLLANSSVNRTLRHSFPSVNCTHSGIIRCEAHSSQRNMSALLLVKCPPTINKSHKLNVSASSGQDVIFFIHVRSHTENITMCLLSRYLNGNSADKDNGLGLSSIIHLCIVKHFFTVSTQMLHDEHRSELNEKVGKCMCTFNGTAPDLYLTLHFFHVTLHDGGRWNLTVANNEGKDNEHIFLRITEFTEKAEGQMWLTVIAASVPLTVVAVVFTVITMVVRSRKFTGFRSKSRKSFEIQSHCSEADVKVAVTKKTNISCCQENKLPNMPIEMLESAKDVSASVNKQDNDEYASKVQQGGRSTNFTIGSMVRQVNCDIDQAKNYSTSVHTAYLTPCQSEISRLHVTSMEVSRQEPQYDVSSLAMCEDGYLNPSLTQDQPASVPQLLYGQHTANAVPPLIIKTVSSCPCRDMQSLSTNEEKQSTTLSVTSDAAVSANQTATSCENNYESFYETLE